MMLDNLGETDQAERIRTAVGSVVAEGKVRTYDMMRLTGGPGVFEKGAATSTQVTDAILTRLA